MCWIISQTLHRIEMLNSSWIIANFEWIMYNNQTFLCLISCVIWLSCFSLFLTNCLVRIMCSNASRSIITISHRILSPTPTDSRAVNIDVQLVTLLSCSAHRVTTWHTTCAPTPRPHPHPAHCPVSAINYRCTASCQSQKHRSIMYGKLYANNAALSVQLRFLWRPVWGRGAPLPPCPFTYIVLVGR